VTAARSHPRHGSRRRGWWERHHLGHRRRRATGPAHNFGRWEAVNGATLTLVGPWTNFRTLAIDNGTLNLGGEFGTLDVLSGRISRATNAGPLNLDRDPGQHRFGLESSTPPPGASTSSGNGTILGGTVEGGGDRGPRHLLPSWGNGAGPPRGGVRTRGAFQIPFWGGNHKKTGRPAVSRGSKQKKGPKGR